MNDNPFPTDEDSTPAPRMTDRFMDRVTVLAGQDFTLHAPDDWVFDHRDFTAFHKPTRTQFQLYWNHTDEDEPDEKYGFRLFFYSFPRAVYSGFPIPDDATLTELGQQAIILCLIDRGYPIYPD